MSYYGDFLPGKTVRVRFNTINASGVPTTLTSGAAIISKDGADVSPSGGVTFTTDVGGVTGRHHLVIDTSADATTFTAGSEYAARLSGSSAVAGTSVVGIVVGEFSLSNRSAVADPAGVTTLLARLTATRAGLLDNLVGIDATVSSRSTYAGGDTAGTGTLLARLTSGRATGLDNLDAAISSRSTYAGGAVASVTGTVNATLVATGLDAISTTAPTGPATTFREMMVAVWRKLYKASAKAAGTHTIKTLADDGTTVITTQTYTDDGAGNVTQGAAT